MDIQILKDQITGLETAIKQAEIVEKKHIKIQTYEEQINKARIQNDTLESQLTMEKGNLDTLKDKRNQAVAGTVDKLALGISKLLPYGEAVIKIEENKLLVGWRMDVESLTPYAGLSGGEKALFDTALADALLEDSDNRIILGEVAEVDTKTLRELLMTPPELQPNTQLLLFTCHDPGQVPDNWNNVVL